MALNIKNQEADRLARRLAQATGESLTTAVTAALRERLERVEGRNGALGLADEIRRIQERIAELPVLDDRTAEEILDYDESGVPR